MKVLILLFLVFIQYSYSIDIKNVPTDGSREILPSSIDDGYFFLSISSLKSNEFLYLLLIDHYYELNNIYFCVTNSYPSEEEIDKCIFNSIKNYGFDKHKAVGILYYYKFNLPTYADYIIIRYSGKYTSGLFCAESTIIPPMDYVYLNLPSDISLSPITYQENYFYSEVSNHSDFHYLYFSDKSDSFQETIFYCLTMDDPKKYPPKNSCFNRLSYSEKNPNDHYNYSYIIDQTSYHGGYIIVKYYVDSIDDAYYSLGARSLSYSLSKPLSTVAIVFIVIGSVVFVGIIIGVIIYCYRKRKANKSADTLTQPDAASSPSNPFVEQNNISQNSI